jgi:sugar/nucleoside kinase (ribokinase family)
MTEWDIVVAGHLCLDMTPRFHDTDARSIGDLLVPGKLVNVGSCVVSTGGPVSNTGLALVKLGMKSLLMGKVGNDAFGMSVVEKMKQYGAPGGTIVVPGEETSYTIALAPPGIDRVFLHSPGANDTFGAADIPYEKLERTRAFHFGYPPLMRRMYLNEGEELVELLKRARERGVTVSLDLSLPDPESEGGKIDWDALLRKALPHVDLFLPSAEEVLFCLDRKRFLQRRNEAREQGVDALELFQPHEYSAMSEQLIGYGAAIAGLKSGHRGIYVRTAGADRLEAMGRARVGDAANWSGRELWEPPFQVDHVASATGAGDSCIAGFLAAFLRGETIESALRYAAAAGAQNVTAHDAVSGIRSFEETRDAIGSWPKRTVEIDAEGWRFDAAGGLWHGPHDAHPPGD